MPSLSLSLTDLVSYLDQYLRVQEIADEANALNGLQVENGGRVGSVVVAVDASQATIEETARRSVAEGGPPLLLVHHGLFWDGNIPLTDRRYRRVRGLLAHDIALYAAHIPLDLHPEVGNNVALAARLGMGVEGWFGSFRGQPIGVWGLAPASIGRRDALIKAVDHALGSESHPAMLIPGGPERVSKIGIISGGAGNMIAAARDAGLDTYITGEGAHYTYFDAIEWGLNVIYAGHYATETLGVQALAVHLQRRFGLPWEFVDQPTGL